MPNSASISCRNLTRYVVGRRRGDIKANDLQVMADEMRSIQSRAKANDSLAQSPRSSLDSGAPRSKATSPAPKDGVGAAINSSSTGQTIATTDYLKNILLQFLEQKDKKHQMQLIPVLGMLLHFDRCVILVPTFQDPL